jgi:hypothetical protein
MDPILEGIFVMQDCSNIDQLPKISFTLDNFEYELEPNDYVLQVKLFGITECILALMPADLPKDFNYFILGDVFMRRYYTYFDKSNDRLGFYDVKNFKAI